MIKQRSIKDSSTFLLISVVIIMTGLIYARDLMGISISKYILLVVAVVPAFFMSYSSLIYFVCFLFPIASGIPDNHVFPLLAIILLIKKPIALQRNALICFFVILFFEFMHYPFYDFSIRLSNVVGYSTTIFFLCYFSVLKQFEVNNKQCIMYFCLGLLVLLLGIWYITRINGGVEMLLESSQRIGETRVLYSVDDTIVLNMNSNALGYYSIVGLSLLFVMYYLNKMRFILLFLMSAVFVYVGSLSVSRTWLISVVLLIVAFMIMIPKVRTTKNGFRYFMLLALVVMGAYALFQNEFIYQAFFNRMTDASVSTGNGRVEAFQDYNKALIGNPFYLIFGAGAIHYGDVLNINLSVHNGLQQILVSYGIIGFVFFLVIAIKAFRMNYRKGFVICSIPFLVAFFFIQSGQFLFPQYNMYPFIACFIALRLSDDDKIIISKK